VIAYDPSEWSDLFVATAGATAALAGLLFVAVSINLERILEYTGLPERALETVLLLLEVLLISIIGLIPGQSHVALGAEIFVVTFLIGSVIGNLPTIQEITGSEPRGWLVGRWTVRLAGTVPLILGGLFVLAEAGGGLYWVAAGFVFAITGAVVNAWVLLVEILR
jgi:MFS-type transporter involved in bile tolerance (Atg22 family)